VSEHVETKKGPVGAVIVLLVLAGLVTWGIGLMNSNDYMASGAAGVLLFFFGLYTVFVLGKE
jgi:protein-S-isoprenylcysteine O-methyltransferase Ste14